ncbi:MAG: hypothetical protein HN352_09485 [Bacteroidetes bacterium]|jgi:hypothetical protein|nr:hypothetical protein [Bacteroidota bacterium]MBT3749892.1 hypothetical protein [Bacteroidota bacterium]MBT4408751.1 hypothetical protein [Bacteroidota bacterium]MBT5426994.1 hypothetical protein [Bacteroidota bacterium]MBT7092050.1 hypothetical protein [Bacteroidota bacterium]
MENDDRRIKNLEHLLDQISYDERQNSSAYRYQIMAKRAHKRYRSRRIYFVSGIAIAASLIGIILLNLNGRNALSGMDLFDKYYETYIYQTEYRADSSVVYPYLVTIQLYQNGDSDHALPSITQLCQEFPDNPDYHLLRSLIHIELQEYKEAENALKTVISQGGSYKTSGLWYLGLCKIANEEYQEAKELFMNFSPQDNEMSKKSRQIAKQLTRLID